VIAAVAMREHLRTKDHHASEEKRAYYRLLRYLVSNELQAPCGEDQARPLQLTDLKGLERHEPFKIH
jgi:hypothetical protein